MTDSYSDIASKSSEHVGSTAQFCNGIKRSLSNKDDDIEKNSTLTTQLGFDPQQDSIKTKEDFWKLADSKNSNDSEGSSVLTKESQLDKGGLDRYSYKNRTGSKFLKISDSGPGLKGLINEGNTCFLNSTIQCLSNVPRLKKYFLKEKFKKKLDANDIKDSISEAFSDLMKYFWNNEENKECTLPLKDFSQQDSHEFLVYLLDGMHEELKTRTDQLTSFKEITIKKPKDDEKKELYKKHLDDLKNSYFDNNSSTISKLFHFMICMKNECLECKSTTLKFDPASFLVVPILIDSYFDSIPIEECLKPIFEKKSNDPFFCSVCESDGRKGEERFTLSSFPPALIIQLKRFEFTSYGMTKNQSQVIFSTELDFSKIIENEISDEILPTYELAAVCNHSGSINFGHYYTFALNEMDKKWYRFDDSYVAQMKENEICLFQRREKRMKLKILGMNNENFTIDVCENGEEFKNYNIKRLKQKIIDEKKLGMAAEELRLIYTGKQLEDDKCLKDYNIDDGSVLMSVVRIKGGILQN